MSGSSDAQSVRTVIYTKDSERYEFDWTFGTYIDTARVGRMFVADCEVMNMPCRRRFLYVKGDSLDFRPAGELEYVWYDKAHLTRSRPPIAPAPGG